ncbi:MAG: hypothetical protein ACE5JV_00320, partial [Nitrososphaerales archaeon]
MTSYPYSLPQNPFPSSPTPTLMDAKVLGGKRHRDAKDAILNCIHELSGKISTKSEASERDFRLITVIQDVGAGKTHLALHIKATQDRVVCSYMDLTTISPKNLPSLYSGVLAGFSAEYIGELKASIIEHIKQKALRNDKAAKKFFRPSFFGSKSFEELAGEVLEGKREPDIRALNEFLVDGFDVDERAMIKKVIYGEFRNGSDATGLEGMLARLAAIAKLNHLFLGKATMLEVDELDANEDAMDFVKAIVNAHLPSSILLLITTPSLYDQIRNANASIFDRLEKANYKIDLAGSSTFGEVSDIVLEYMRQGDEVQRFAAHEDELMSRLRVIFDEFSEFRNIRSMLNIMYHAMEVAGRNGASTLTEDALEETIKQAYPGLTVRGSIMNVPISEFIRIRRETVDSSMLEGSVKDAVKSLVMFAHEQGRISKPEQSNGHSGNGTRDVDDGIGVDTVYGDPSGS